MRCTWTQTFGFRCLRDERLDWHPRFNLIVGTNGAGKSSLLETLQIVARGRSARAPAQSLARYGEPAWRVDAGLLDDAVMEHRVRVHWQDRLTTVVADDAPATALDLARLLPMLRIEPESHRLLDDGPAMRRQLVDWGVFHMEHQFLRDWRRARHCLQQRNAALRAALTGAEISVWNHELELAANRIDEARQRYIVAVNEACRSMADTDDDFVLELHAGWNRDEGLSAALDRNTERDRAHGHTSVGPHRAELRILHRGRLAKGRISRGQQKALIARIVLAQIEVFHRQNGTSPMLLVDDFASELSKDAQARLLDRILLLDSQVFMTALDPDTSEFLPSAHTMFHVEHGHVTSQSLQ